MAVPSFVEYSYGVFLAVGYIIFGSYGAYQFALDDYNGETKNWFLLIGSLTVITLGILICTSSSFDKNFTQPFIGTWLGFYGLMQIVRVALTYSTLSWWGMVLFSGVSSLLFSSVMLFNWPMQGISNVAMYIGPSFIIIGLTIFFEDGTSS